MAKSKKVLDHVHKLKRIKYTNGESIYFCINGACEYEINVKKALGKPNECHRCGKTFQLNELSLRLAKPHCTSCTKGKIADVETKAQSNPEAINKGISSPADDLRTRLSSSITSVLSTSPEPDEADDLL